MASLNKVFLIGNLTKDPEVRHTPKGTAVGDLGLAINSTYRTADGVEKEETVFVDLVVWGRQAETCKEYLTKGSPIFVEGRLQLDQWESQGEKKSRLRVRAERVQFLSRGGTSSGGGARSSYTERDSSRSAPPPSGHDEEVPSDDDVPF
jgi:single-strand DNA-binding protein